MSLSRALCFLAVLPFASCSCGDDILVPQVAGTCEPTFVCPANFEYRLGACRSQRCAGDTDCCPGQTCNAALGLCISEFENTVCSDNSQCEVPGQECITFRGGQFCGYPNKTNALSTNGTQRCETDAECALGRSCFGKRCINAAPCEGGCPSGSICELDSNTCYPFMACEAVCGPGQIQIVADSDTMSASQCCLVECKCETLPDVMPGIYGWYAASAATPTEILVSAYDPNYGDLVVAHFGLDGVKKSVDYVDGYPTSGPVVGNPQGVRDGRIEPGPNVGLHTSIAVDSTGIAHVAYYDKDLGALRYANNSGGLWKTVIVDDEGDTGYYTSIALASDGSPRIAYMMVNGTLTPDPTPKTALKLATARSNLPLLATDWTIEAVDSQIKPELVCGGGCARDLACVDLGMGPVCAPTAVGCGTCASGEACVSHTSTVTCEGRINSLPLDDLIDGTGLFASLAIKSTGVVSIAYYDRLNGDLRLATTTATGTFKLQTLDGNEMMSPTDVGQHCSLAVGPGDVMGVAYVDASKDDLVYLDLSTGMGAREIVDDGVTPPNLRMVGADAALVFDDTGAPAIAYQDPTNIDLLYARRLGPPPWSVEVIRGAPAAGMMRGTAAGFYVDQVKSGMKAYVTSVDVDFDPEGELLLDVVVTQKPLN